MQPPLKQLGVFVTLSVILLSAGCLAAPQKAPGDGGKGLLNNLRKTADEMRAAVSGLLKPANNGSSVPQPTPTTDLRQGLKNAAAQVKSAVDSLVSPLRNATLPPLPESKVQQQSNSSAGGLLQTALGKLQGLLPTAKNSSAGPSASDVKSVVSGLRERMLGSGQQDTGAAKDGLLSLQRIFNG